MRLKYIFCKNINYWLRPLALVLALAGPGCRSRDQDRVAAGEQITVTDDLGRQLKIPRYPKRVMGLAPSATEMLYAVSDEDYIIARTQNCDYPAPVKNKPVVNNYPLDYETLVKLKPDLVFTVEGIGFTRPFYTLEEGIQDYVQQYLVPNRYL